MVTARNESANRLEIYNFDRQIKNTLEKLGESISEENYQIISKYDRLLVSLSQSKASRLRNLKFLKLLTAINKDRPWSEITADQVQEIVYHIMTRYSPDGQETWTTYDYKKVLKEFVRWVKLGSRSHKEVGDPIETKQVKINKVRDTIVREDLLTEKDLANILSICSNLQDRALIHTQYEAGTRPAEILNLKLKHVQYDKNGIIRIKVDGKTGSRLVTLVESVPDLIKWLHVHPFKDNPEAPLWIVLFKVGYGKQLSYAAARKMFMKRCEQAKLGKRVYMNLFRHSEATRTAQFMTDAQLKKRHGWSARSNMPARYVHMQDQDVENAVLSHYGISVKEEESARLPIKCKSCNSLNSPDVKRCENCSQLLSLEAILAQEEREELERQQDREWKGWVERTLKGIEILVRGSVKNGKLQFHPEPSINWNQTP